MARILTISRVALIVFALLPLAGCGGGDSDALRLLPPAALNVPRWINIETGVEFGQADGKSLRYDMYRPAWLTSPLPLVILIHGGSWRGGSRDQMAEFAYD